MLNIIQFREEVVRTTLKDFDASVPYSQAAENLLVGTALQESRLVHLKQFGSGPALGVYQIEPETHMDLWKNFINYRQDLRDRILTRTSVIPSLEQQLVTSLSYATIIARLIYWRVAEPMPEAQDLEGLAKYYKKYYNTLAGKATAAEWLEKYRKIA